MKEKITDSLTERLTCILRKNGGENECFYLEEGSSELWVIIKENRNLFNRCLVESNKSIAFSVGADKSRFNSENELIIHILSEILSKINNFAINYINLDKNK